MPSLIYDGSYFILRYQHGERELPKASGFRLSDDLKMWYTADPKSAVKLRQFAEGAAKEQLDRIYLSYEKWEFGFAEVPSACVLKPHQVLSLDYALSRNRCYLGLDPGLGKTPIAAVFSATLETPIVFLSPPFLVLNVEEEFKKWAPSLRVANLNTLQYADLNSIDVLIIPDSLLARADIVEHVKEFLKVKTLSGSVIDPPTLIVDEAHRFKTDDAKRTRALFGFSPKASRPVPGLVDYFPRQVYMSGTPMPNRPIELYPVLSKAAPETIDFMNRFEYAKRFCGAYQNKFGWDFSGASNLEELQSRVYNKFMLRLRIDLLDLPPKIEEIFVLSDDMSPQLAKFDKGILDSYSSVDDLMKQKIKANSKDGGELHLMSYRRKLGIEKVDATAKYIKMLLEDTDENILVFALHKEVIASLAEALESYSPLIIVGDTPVNRRHEIVKLFQNPSAGKRILLGNYQAMGIGNTLTKATREIFLEFSWNPGENDQASARAHRIGQKNTVYVQYVVYKDSIDKKVIEALLEKKEVRKFI